MTAALQPVGGPCPGSGLPGGVFAVPGLAPGVTCQVCGADLVSSDGGAGDAVPPHEENHGA